jgi:uncharacterized protein YegL
MKDATEIAVVIDESGSMEGLTQETITGFNKFLKDQQALPGEATMSVQLFNTGFRNLCLNTPIKDVKPLSTDTYKAAGYTALLDAVGNLIDSLGKKFAAMNEDERPNKVVVVILTDGEENSSREYKLDQIKSKISEQQAKYGWTFLFLGANQDAFSNARGMGVPIANALNYAATSKGTKQAYGIAGQCVANVRSGQGPKSFT